MSRSAISVGILVFWFACCVGLAGGRAQASSIEISPVRVDLSAGIRVGALTVHNTGEDETVMQVSLNSWPLSDAINTIEPTNELLITPTTFRLAGGAVQIVRVGLRGEAPLQTEAAYRLIIEEVPAMQELGSTRMRLLVRHDLPVFVASVAPSLHKVQIDIDCPSNGASLHMRNLGNSHLKVLRVALLEPATGTTQGDWNTFEYLLSGDETWWLLSSVAPNAKALAYTATVYTEQGALLANVQNQCR